MGMMIELKISIEEKGKTKEFMVILGALYLSLWVRCTDGKTQIMKSKTKNFSNSRVLMKLFKNLNQLQK